MTSFIPFAEDCECESSGADFTKTSGPVESVYAVLPDSADVSFLA